MKWCSIRNMHIVVWEQGKRAWLLCAWGMVSQRWIWRMAWRINCRFYKQMKGRYAKKSSRESRYLIRTEKSLQRKERVSKLSEGLFMGEYQGVNMNGQKCIDTKSLESHSIVSFPTVIKMMILVMVMIIGLQLIFIMYLPCANSCVTIDL